MSSTDLNAVNLLNKNLCYFLYNRLKWKKFNPIQEKTIPVILNGEDTLVIAPTASGKTEAVLIPIFSQILNEDFKPLSVLYIAPLKALINDIHDRMELWGDYFNLKITKWHGDVPKSKKDSFIKNPTDFLAITPESLEVIFMNKRENQKKKIFGNLKYIIVDEIHYFADSDRGTQLNSLINRINKYTQKDLIRIGLSATIGNPEVVSKWLNHNYPAKIISTNSNRKFKYKVLTLNDNYDSILKSINKYKDKKILVFVNSRSDAEFYYNLIKTNLKIKNIFIHHSSIDKNTREEVEYKFKNERNGFMISTSTLELGIDIGNIDIVMQINPPVNVSSFLQRIGRSGRKSKDSRTIIFADDLDIFITLAELILIEENNIEKINISTDSKDIFFHQILSSIYEYGNVKVKELYESLCNCFVFSDITYKNYIEMLKTMNELDLINIHDNKLTLGFAFEEKFGKRNFIDFYTVFCPNYEYKIKSHGKNIGSVDPSFIINHSNGTVFALSGKYWKIININNKLFTINVEGVSSKNIEIPFWMSGKAPINYLISRKVYEIFLGNFDRKFLGNFDNETKKIIDLGIDNAKKVGFNSGIIPVEIDENKVWIYTFAGDKVNILLSNLFSLYYDINNIDNNFIYSSFIVKEQILFEDIENILLNIENILSKTETLELLNELMGKFYKNKFINFIPYDDKVKLKMSLLFDVEGLIKVCSENSIVKVDNVQFDKWFDE